MLVSFGGCSLFCPFLPEREQAVFHMGFMVILSKIQEIVAMVIASEFGFDQLGLDFGVLVWFE